jgi:glycine/D-amino acid oxidase-like deaminating enzyme
MNPNHTKRQLKSRKFKESGYMTQHPKSHVTINTPLQFQDELPEKVDIAIIGGGVIGVFTALYLTRMGKSVIVLEKGRIAGEQSSRNWGWIRKHGRDEAELPIMIEAARLWYEANDQTNGQCGVTKAAVNFLSITDKKQDQFEAWIKLAAEHGVKSHMLTRKQIADIFTGQSDARWQMGTTTPDDARGEPWVAVSNIAKLAQQEGAKIVENCAVRMLDIHAGQIKGVITEQGCVNCEQVVLAGGAWSSLFAKDHGIDLPQLAVSSSVVQTAPMAEFTSQNSHDEAPRHPPPRRWWLFIGRLRWACGLCWTRRIAPYGPLSACLDARVARCGLAP